MPQSSIDLYSGENTSVGDQPAEKTLFRVLKHPYAVVAYHSFLRYRPICSEEPFKWSIMSIRCLDAWISTPIQCWKVHESHGGHHQKLFVDTLYKLFQKAADQFIGTIRQYFIYWHPRELYKPHGVSHVQERLHSTTRMGSIGATVPRLSNAYIVVRKYWFQNYIDRNLGSIHNCYIAEVANDVCSLKPLGDDEPTR